MSKPNSACKITVICSFSGLRKIILKFRKIGVAILRILQRKLLRENPGFNGGGALIFEKIEKIDFFSKKSIFFNFDQKRRKRSKNDGIGHFGRVFAFSVCFFTFFLSMAGLS